MYFFRTQETHELYEEHKHNGHLNGECPLCAADTIVQFKLWRIIDNRFPYDRVCKVHHMLIPNRHITEFELTQDEKEELLLLKHSYINEQYTFVIEALPRHKSIPSHFHLHLVVPKDEI